MSITLNKFISDIDAVLPQTQCEQCGYKGCLLYATALANNETEINRCPPGGDAVLAHLAKITKHPIMPLDANCGEHKLPQVMRIEESLCIGCTKCIQACPVDAIIGTKKMMHTINRSECTGCELCIPPCPLDCIVTEALLENSEAYQQYFVPHRIGLTALEKERAERSRYRFNARKKRLQERISTSRSLLPQEEMKLAERKTTSEMLALIQQAKKHYQQK